MEKPQEDAHADLPLQYSAGFSCDARRRGEGTVFDNWEIALKSLVSVTFDSEKEQAKWVKAKTV